MWKEYHSMESYSRRTSVYWNCWRQKQIKRKQCCPAMKFVTKMLQWAAKAISVLTRSVCTLKKKKESFSVENWNKNWNVVLVFVGGLGLACLFIWVFFWWGGVLFVRFGLFFKKGAPRKSYRKQNCFGFHISTTLGKSLLSSSIYLNEGIGIPCLNADGTWNYIKKRIFFYIMKNLKRIIQSKH